MAKITLTDISSGYLSLATYNANNTLLEAAIENTLSRDGTSPNTMSANLDMNSNRVTNVTDAADSQDAVSLAQLTAATVVASSITAALVSLADSGGNYTATTAEAAFTELASVSTGEGASIIGVEDSGGYFAGTDVEAVLADIGANYVTTANDNTFAGLFYLTERAAAGADVVGDGQLWVKLATPNEPWFTDDAGTDGRLISSVHDQAEAVVDNVVLKDFGVSHSNPASASGVLTLDLTTSRSFLVDLTENITSIVIQNPNTTGIWCEFAITFVQDGTGSWTVGGWPTEVKWPGGAAPTITTTATTGTDIVTLKTYNAGTTYLADVSQDYS